MNKTDDNQCARRSHHVKYHVKSSIRSLFAEADNIFLLLIVIILPTAGVSSVNRCVPYVDLHACVCVCDSVAMRWLLRCCFLTQCRAVTHPASVAPPPQRRPRGWTTCRDMESGRDAEHVWEMIDDRGGGAGEGGDGPNVQPPSGSGGVGGLGKGEKGGEGREE